MEYWKEGQRAFAYWDEDEYFYPATIVSIEDEDIYIRFDTGEEEWTTAEYLEEYAAETGEEVECKFSQNDLYYNAVVLEADGERIQVKYEDGVTEWSALNRIRFYID
jgi:hypothetical protein